MSPSSSTGAVAPTGQEHEINLISGVIDAATMTGSAILAFLDGAGADESHVLVRFGRVVTDNERADLETKGLYLLAYLPYTAWLGYVAPDVTLTANDLAMYDLEYVAYLEPERKLDFDPGRGDYFEWALIVPNRLRVNIYFHDDVELAIINQVLLSHGITQYGYTEISNSVVADVEMDAAHFEAIADEDDVKWVTQIGAPLQVANDGARATSFVDDVQQAPYGIDGSGVNVMIWEDYSVRIGDNPPGHSPFWRQSYSWRRPGTLLCCG